MKVNNLLLVLIALLIAGLLYKLRECSMAQKDVEVELEIAKAEGYNREYNGIGLNNRGR